MTPLRQYPKKVTPLQKNLMYIVPPPTGIPNKSDLPYRNAPKNYDPPSNLQTPQVIISERSVSMTPSVQSGNLLSMTNVETFL